MSTRIPATSLAALVLLGACGDSSTDESADDDSSQASASATESPPVLDLASLQADTAVGTYHAELIEPTYVAEVDTEMFIGVIFDPDAASAGQEIRAYLCNGNDVTHWLAGEIDSSGSATLTPEMLLLEDDPDIRVELSTNGDLSGSVLIDGEDSQPFTLTSATGDAGIYRAEETFDENTSVASWIVLPDGRQVGGACEILRCGRNPMSGAKVCFCVKRK